MSRLVWDQTGEHYFETGVDQGVLFPYSNGAYQTGVAWNGLTNVNESPSGAEPTALYADNIKYLNLLSTEDFGFTIEAFYSPEEFDACDGCAALADGVIIHQQKRSPFGFVYRSKLGNDTDGVDYGYKIHIVYNALAKPTEKAHNTINETPEAGTLSWECSTTPVTFPGFNPTAHIEIDSTKVDSEKLKELEDLIYGKDATTDPVAAATNPTMPLPADLVRIFGQPA